MPITRRDFLNGIALTIGAGLTPMQQLLAQSPAARDYPPALTGLRGNQPGSNLAAHNLALRNQHPTISESRIANNEHYDLIVVGSGISGLSAAYFYQQKQPNAKILILDNHDDFGGHARRNELGKGATFRLSSGGSENMEEPHSYSKIVTTLLQELGINIDAFKTDYQTKLYPELGLKTGVFLDQNNWGKSQILIGDGQWGNDDLLANLKQLPLSDPDKAKLREIYENQTNYLPDLHGQPLADKLKKISYEKYLTDHAGLSQDAVKFLRAVTSDEWGYTIDLYSAYDAHKDDFPGLGGLNWEDDKPDDSEDYIYHFPDGNASIARLLIAKLIPNAISAKNMEAVITAALDYSQLDRPQNPIRLRLNSTAINAINQDNGVRVAYTNGKNLSLAFAKKCVMAGNNDMIPWICPEVSSAQNFALRQNVKNPMLYAKILVSNWDPFIKLSTDYLYCPTAPYFLMRLDFPVNLGDYHSPAQPEQAMVIHMAKTMVPYGSGTPLRSAYRAGREILINQPYEALEAELLAQLKELYSLANTEPDILAITINRWAHGYSYEQKHLWDDPEEMAKTIATARQPIGNIHIANADAAWRAYLDASIEQAHRAISEMG